MRARHDAIRLPLSLAAVLVLAMGPAVALGQAELIDDLGGPEGFGTDTLEPGDDAASAAVGLSDAFPNGLNFFGEVYSEIFVNNNGNVTFNESVPFFIPEAFPVSDQPMIAPWWGDVDTRLQGAGIANDVYYVVDAPDGRFVVTWYEVGHFSLQTDERNTFQLILTDRSDVAPGDFDVELRYNRCEWHTGDRPLSGADPVPAQAGFDAGDGTNFVALPGSLTPRVVDLCTTSNRDDPGVWVFEIRVGDVRICGNDIVELDEECDDGGETVDCDLDCTTPACGDGLRNETAGEACDDGNRAGNDGCADDCSVELGWDCERGIAAPDRCDPICGDGLLRGGEACDDGNQNRGDGCSVACTVEPGFICEGEPSVCRPDVGDDGADVGLDAATFDYGGGGVSDCAQTGWADGARGGGAGLLVALVALAALGRRRRSA